MEGNFIFEIGDDLFEGSNDLPYSVKWSPLDVLRPGSPTLHFRSERLEEFPWDIGLVIFEILNDFLQPSSNLSAFITAARVDALDPENRGPGDEEEPGGGFIIGLWGTWYLISRARFHANILHWRNSSISCGNLSKFLPPELLRCGGGSSGSGLICLG